MRWRRRGALLIAGMVLAGQLGCAARPPVPVGVASTSPPPSPAVRARLGTVGVATGRFTPPISLAIPPSGPTAGAQQGAATGMAVLGYPALLLAPVTFGASLILLPVGALVGAPIGAVTAAPGPETGGAEAVLATAQRDLGPRLHPMLRDRVVVLARARASRILSILPDHGPSAVVDRVDYRGRAAEGVASVLEVRIVGLGLMGLQASQPTMSCFLGTRTRLVRTSDGTTLYESTIGYVGAARPLDEWMADSAARFREEVEAATSWTAGQVVEQVFLRPSQPEDLLRVRVKPTTLSDLEGRLFGESGLLQGSRRFDAEFEGVTLQAEEGRRLRALLPEVARAPRGSEFTLAGMIDGVPFTIEMEKDAKTRVSADLEGLVFAHPSEAQAFVESFGPPRPGAEVTLDGYAGGRRIRVTLRREGVAVADRGPGAPPRRAERIEPDDALEMHVLPATLEDIRAKLLGEQGLVTRGQRFEAEFEEVALVVDDIESLIDLFRSALRARPRSELELDGTLEGLPFTATLAVDREGRSRLGFEGFLFATEAAVDQFVARFKDAEGLRELTVTGSVAGHKLHRTHRWQ